MTRYNKIAATAVLAAVTGFNAFPQSADAATLLDLLRGGPARSKPMVNSVIDPQANGGLEMGDPEPLPKVTGPRYYTYKAEATRPIVIPAAAAVGAEIAPVTGARNFLSAVKVNATADVAAAVEDYYKAGKPLIWVSEAGITDQARAAMAALAAADVAGLSPEDYAVALPSDASDPADPDKPAKELARFELALSAKLLTYINDTVRGRIDPNKLSGYHDFKRKSVNLKPVLNMARLSPDVGAYIRSRDPDNSQFVAMRDELARLRAEDDQAGVVVTIAPDTLLKPGQSNPELANILAAIKKQASDAIRMQHGAVLESYAGTPDYTPELVAVVEAFQQEKGLKPDGVIGRATIRALTGHSNAEKIEKLIVAMEEIRWLPADFGPRYVFINQPAYMAYYVNDGHEQLSMRVVVGSKSNQTYFFQDQIETVEFNPYWGVPKSIIVNEMLPKLRQDPSYLDRLGYEVSYNGRTVSSTAVDWNTTHSVDVRQPPGGDNALGELKILFPNAHAIYMHDTPSKSFFKRDMRALSHGCVRLAEPRVMAAAVMGTNVGEIAKQIASGQNRAVQVPQKIPVYVSYFTAWPNKNGVVEYFDDVYGRDAATLKAFKVTSDARSRS
ncbi:L,D-transpeptidase family protein [Rhizobium cremeum]|uniref:L,D-transpeptidase family protein n=1 Tax=Rhizobium cremeum TaxID=2813827 RepID=UPI001FD5C6E7|nr:L,D-transpeptidase family protein [Rhizobium cremeum]MCJ7993159.1 L,D-transpeptidase family protein [Rhizobium cremeum]MCJ7998224.1 L,D-transpeptidase family protein [Rhizobium cremeum]